MINQIESVYEFVPLNKLLQKGDQILIPHKKKEILVEYVGRSIDGMIHLNHQTKGTIVCRTGYFNQSAQVVRREEVANRFLNQLKQ